jgi:hypothetical protein
MELISIKKNELKRKMKVAPINIHGKGYIRNGILYKMCFSCPDSFYRLDFLDKNRYTNKINYPINKIYIESEPYFKYGYTQTYYDGRPNLANVIDDQMINSNIRLKMAEYISVEIEKMHQHDFTYSDLHLEQILTENHDILFIDMDSIMPKTHCNNYDRELKFDLQCCATLIISFLYHYDLELADSDYIERIIKQLSLNKTVKQYLIESAIKHNINNVYMHQFLKEFDEEKINHDIKHVTKRLTKN